MQPTTNITAARHNGYGAGTAKGLEATFILPSSPWNQNLHGPKPANLRDDYLTKSKGSSARWSGSERKITKARQQELDKARQEKAAFQRVFDLGIAKDEGDTPSNSELAEQESLDEEGSLEQGYAEDEKCFVEE